MKKSIQQLLTVYAGYEPAGADRWNPLENDRELWHRVRLLIEAKRALTTIGARPEQLKVLDVGCGVGRSTRMLVELGLRPENICGIDFRASAIEHARATNPRIRFLAIEDLAGWPTETFDLAMQCTAFSSIEGGETERETARRMMDSVGPSGWIWWWDRITANDFADGRTLAPDELFSGCDRIYRRKVGLRPSIWEVPNRGRRFFSRLQDIWPAPTSHCSALFRKR